MPRKSKNAAINALEGGIELHVASRMRLRRGLLGMSQSDVAKQLGITFQQYQKYERSDNRVSVAKLYRLADILDVPLGFFFDGLAPGAGGRDPRHVSANLPPAEILSRRELDLLRAWRAAPPQVADEVSGLLRAVEQVRDAQSAATTEAVADLASIAVESAAPVAVDSVELSPRAPIAAPAVRRGGRRQGARDGLDAIASRGAGGNRVWSPKDIYR